MLTDREHGFDRELFFVDRRDAGVSLAAALQRFRSSDVVVLGLPRGGVPVAAEVARRLDAELDVIVARKLGSPDSPELAIGAITADGERVLNEDVIGLLGVSPAYLEAVSSAQQAEARRRETRFRGGRPAPRITGRTVVLVDDGLATGATMRAAVRAVRKRGPSRLVVAVPVGSPDACRALRAEADEVVTLGEPEYFTAVGSFYRDFRQVEDTEVQRLLEERAPASAT
jgi:putative phosphoribosyl transferase